MDYTDYAQPWQTQQRQAVRLPTRANNRFFYKHHPKNWELYHFEIENKTSKKTTEPALRAVWLPKLSSHHETAGVNGSRMSGGRIDSSISRTRLGDSGWQLLPPEKHDYLRQYPCRNGVYWADRFTKLENLGGDLVQSFDYDEFARWRAELMAAGHLALPHETFLKRQINLNARRINRIARDQHIPEIAAKLKALQDLEKDMKSAMADVMKQGRAHYEL
jgi:hypothetical protein